MQRFAQCLFPFSSFLDLPPPLSPSTAPLGMECSCHSFYSFLPKTIFAPIAVLCCGLLYLALTVSEEGPIFEKQTILHLPDGSLRDRIYGNVTDWSIFECFVLNIMECSCTVECWINVCMCFFFLVKTRKDGWKWWAKISKSTKRHSRCCPFHRMKFVTLILPTMLVGRCRILSRSSGPAKSSVKNHWS